ncbi:MULTISPECIES: DeoD-type purine-nucleoside phosphorylase [unclassified Mesorhizobium]|uniref:purine-nucleoside phosphorylase n=1 Tax=unclassified Mesorhizobium TaxID=325217 RepID=UPI000FCBC76E|nr:MULTISPECIES: DeoD-type purine-nucleoside phosphorylase [unclassified Mesorhizobium]RVD55364.1 DeoD-type purine-nucleoside phosphorylase [Mesorhizobium sp. M8A.F.Ca.ET.023.02.2.1]TGR39380.1 DeoD-type purine-nucleoside phosphorylase [bacterium M00.F.Ca.ET.199.01.1.1]TGU28816.1 DeoD-type purine-nucleoside phosphorylase [bacterium M00.F.Ca.ET.156.01.1.1]TGV16396.1 DeoD-type purine-nucleoside phosphorylase [Mesorhizobium sp. M8A.F.Ca.ET.173.01.1.1]TGV61478.1 DeoD-type purine-nucleoside phosphor
MTPHIEASKGDYADTILLPGDPQRAEWMAGTFLDTPRCVNRRRGALGFTGSFRGRPISIQATGIGVSSFLIYAHELLDYYGARTLIRTGTCGGLSAEAKLRSLVISQSARPEDTENGRVFGLYEADVGPDPALLACALAKATELGIDHHAGLTACTDIFYHPDPRARYADARALGALAVDMETSALYRISAHFGARALSLLTVVDNLLTGEQTDYSERQELFTDMSRLALEIATEAR